MRSRDFRLALDELARATGRAVFGKAGIERTVLRQDSRRSVERTLAAAVADRLLVRVCRGVFVYEYARRDDMDVVAQIVLCLRQGEYSYVSLECALARWGVIEQEPLGALTVMTTGRSQMFETPYGRIEFTHTERKPADVVGETVCANPRLALPLAKPRLALNDLRRVRRNLDLVDEEAVEVAELEMAA